jgi:hypothetical protein
MGKSAKKHKNRVPRLTEQQYAEYLMSLKEQTPPNGYKEGFEYISDTMEGKTD